MAKRQKNKALVLQVVILEENHIYGIPKI